MTPHSHERIALRLLRSSVLAAVGFGVGLICAFGAKRVGGGDWVTGAFPWIIGSVIAVAFATSEVFNERNGRDSGLLRRLLVSGGIVLFILVVAGVLCRALGFGRITYDHDPWLIHRVVIALLLFGASVSLARNIWLRNNPRKM